MKMERKNEMIQAGAVIEKVNGGSSLANHTVVAGSNGRTKMDWQQAEATYTMLFEESTEMIFISRYDGLILDINRNGCRMLQQPKEVFSGGELALIAPQLKTFLAQQAGQLKTGGEAFIELEVKKADLQPLPLEIKARQVHYKGEAAVMWVGRDISARKEVERLRQDTMAMLIHDLRGPLGNLLNVIELISMVVKNGANLAQPKIAHLLKMGKQSGQTIQDLADSILDVSWLEQGKAPLQYSTTNLKQLLQAVEEQMLPQALAKKMDFTIQPPSETVEVWLDSNLMRRVLVNLVSNAIKYTPAEGHVSLTTRLTTERLHFAVSDDGPGISKANQAHIFDKFSRVDYSANAPDGVGLGLAFCKLAIEAHHGAIAVESEGIPGKGSTFQVAIPLISPPEFSDQ
jgi:PAS domain S-box-containing protein